MKSLWRSFLRLFRKPTPCDWYVRELRAAKERAKERREARAREEMTKEVKKVLRG